MFQWSAGCVRPPKKESTSGRLLSHHRVKSPGRCKQPVFFHGRWPHQLRVEEHNLKYLHSPEVDYDLDSNTISEAPWAQYIQPRRSLHFVTTLFRSSIRHDCCCHPSKCHFCPFHSRKTVMESYYDWGSMTSLRCSCHDLDVLGLTHHGAFSTAIASGQSPPIRELQPLSSNV